MYRFICLKFINIEKQFKTLSLDGPWAILDEYHYNLLLLFLLDDFIIFCFISVHRYKPLGTFSSEVRLKLSIYTRNN